MNTVSTPDKAGLSSWFPGYLALTLIWGASFLFIKVGVSELHPTYVTLGRVGTGALTVLGFMLVSRAKLPRDWCTWGHLAVVGTLGVGLPFTLFGYGEQRVSSVLAGIWNATTPLWVLPVAVLVFRTERFTVRKAIGVGLGFTGVLVVLGVWQGVGGAQLSGQLMCMGAALCYGLAIPYLRRFLNDVPDGGVAVPAGMLIAATAVLAVVAPLVAGPPPALTDISPAVIGSVVGLGALGTGLAFVLNMRVIRFAGATTSASVTYLIPIVATVVGVVALGEHVSWYQPVGAMIVLLGVAVSQDLLRLPARPRHRTAPVREPAVAVETAS
ncbi:MAG: DMT family transporter [Micromonosporaceae bacterium]